MRLMPMEPSRQMRLVRKNNTGERAYTKKIKKAVGL